MASSGKSIRLASATLALLIAWPSQATSPPPYPLWLSGCWQGDGRSAGVTEAWTDGRIGRMLGVGQTLRGTRASFEFMQISTAANAQLVFSAQPGGRTAVQFKANVVEPMRIVFANPEHDAPKTIEYRRDGERLSVYLDAPAAGAVPTFTFRRIECDSIFPSK